MLPTNQESSDTGNPKTTPAVRIASNKNPILCSVSAELPNTSEWNKNKGGNITRPERPRESERRGVKKRQRGQGPQERQQRRQQ
mmetsp:Transcript_21111/g.58718  ORF Transcript_21111/g.58718 Transcript_21111/m.58718 type:complete len:84 (+) Transcript_21111:155-406(+)